LIPQYCDFSKAQQVLPEDGPVGPKHVGARDILTYVLTFYVFNKRVHLLVERILRYSNNSRTEYDVKEMI
jgi:hypothetical protein